jgi:hypothetical protein
MIERLTLPDYPVILVHLDDRGLAACCGRTYHTPSDTEYPKVPRMLCPGCAVATR